MTFQLDDRIRLLRALDRIHGTKSRWIIVTPQELEEFNTWWAKQGGDALAENSKLLGVTIKIGKYDEPHP